MVKQSIISKTTLISISNLFKELHEHDIVYCHWKGHDAHMMASLSGNSDLDILFDSNQKSKLESLVLTLGFKRFESVKEKQSNDVVDYLALDIDSEKLVHLHAHYKLKIGKPLLKEYDLNLEQRILNSRVFNIQYDTYCIHPNFQLVLFYLTESLKLRSRDRVRFFFKRKRKLSVKITTEYQWLKSITSLTEVRYIFHEIIKHPEPINRLIEGELSLNQLFRLAHLFSYEFFDDIRYFPLLGTFIRWYREFILLVKTALVKILASPIPIRRVNPRGGRVLAFNGEDKITTPVLNALQNVFCKKLDVFQISFDQEKSNHNFSLSRSDKYKLNRLLRARKKGMLVLCEYFPAGLEKISDESIAQYLPDIIFNWKDGDDTINPYEKISSNSKHRSKVVPVNPAVSFDKTCSLVNFETWKIL